MVEKFQVVGVDEQKVDAHQLITGKPVFWHLPNDYRNMVEARNNGVPLVEQAPKAPVTGAFQGLAEALLGSDTKTDDDDSTAGKQSVFGRLFKMGSSKGQK